MKKFLVFTFLLLSLFLVACTKEITVTFVYGDKSEDIVIQKGESCTPITPNVEGYTLEGWYYEDTFVTPYEGEVIEKSTSLYANLVIKSFTVTFKNGSIELKKETVNYGNAATAPSTPTRDGYDFVSWDKAFDNVKSDLTVEARWSIQKLTVVFYDGETQLAEEAVDYGQTVSTPEDPEHVGKTFIGWGLEDGTIVDTDEAITESVELYAMYEIIKYTVVFKNGSTTLKTEQVEYGKDATAPTDPTKAGYEFTSWDKDYDEVTANLEVNAQFQIINYDISYFDGLSKLTHTPTSFTVEASTITLTEYKKTGYEFEGWFENSDFTGAKVTTIAKGTSKVITLYGKWVSEALIKDLVFETNGGSFTWENKAITNASAGISTISDLPVIFAQDFFTYLKDNNLLASSSIHSTMKVTDWTGFTTQNPNHSGDPYSIWCDSSTNLAAGADGYCIFLYDSATGNASTGELLTITGGFLGTEPYKTKYWEFSCHLAAMQHVKYTANEFWTGNNAKTLAGFIIDGYFYGTQGAGSGNFAALRGVIPNSNEGYTFVGTTLTKHTTDFGAVKFKAQDVELPAPSKKGFVFRGWFDNEGLTGTAVYKLAGSATPADKYYAKWEAIA